MNSSSRGLGAMSKEAARKIQSEGGKASPQNFANNPSLASLAGSKGGRARRKNSRSG